MLLMGHRGIPWDWPENSLLSFRKALDAGIDILEFDVRLSRDGVPVIMHDADLDRTTDSKGAVGDMDYTDLKKARIIFTKTGPKSPGEPIPNLGETLTLLQQYPRVIINCEIKDYSDACVEKSIEACREARLIERSVFTCFDYRVLQKIKEIDPSLKVQGFPLELMKGLPGDDPGLLGLFDYIGVRFDGATKEKIDKYKKAGLITGVWVVNNPEDIQSCIDMGVTIITSDRADILGLALSG